MKTLLTNISPVIITIFILQLIFSACIGDNASDNEQTDSLSITDSMVTPVDSAELNDTISIEADSILVDTLTVIGVGDIMLGTDYPSKSYLPPGNDCTPLLADVKSILQDADVTFGNLEGCFLDSGEVVKKCDNPALCYAFRTPEAYFDCIIDAGFDIFSLANNHSGDFGARGRNSTKRLIEGAGLCHAGLLNSPTMVFKKDDIRYGLAAFSPIDGTCRIETDSIPEAQRIVRELAKKSDIVIVSFHGGAEGRSRQHVPRKTEIFYDEDRGNVYLFARKMIDAGADIVFGHGPHVTRAIDLYKNRFIAYSLGNFCTYGRFSLKGASGVAPIIKVFIGKRGHFLEAKVTPVYQTKTHGPKTDPQKRAIKQLQELTEADFPESGLTITDEGRVYKK